MKNWKNSLKRSFHNYLHSFSNLYKLKQTFVIDLISMFGLFGLFLLLEFLVTKISEKYMGKVSAESLQEVLLSGSTTQVETYVNDMYMFLLFFFLSLIIFFVLSYFVYYYSRSLIWNRIIHKKLIFKHKFKWALMVLVFLGLITVIIVPLAVIQLVIQETLTLIFNNPNVVMVGGGLYGIVALLFIFYLYFSIKYHFTKTNKVWHSIGDAFATLKTNAKKLSTIFIYQFLTILIINLAITYPLTRLLNLPILLSILQFLLFIFFLSWSRIYFYQTVKS